MPRIRPTWWPRRVLKRFRITSGRWWLCLPCPWTSKAHHSMPTRTKPLNAVHGHTHKSRRLVWPFDLTPKSVSEVTTFSTDKFSRLHSLEQIQSESNDSSWEHTCTICTPNLTRDQADPTKRGTSLYSMLTRIDLDCLKLVNLKHAVGPTGRWQIIRESTNNGVKDCHYSKVTQRQHICTSNIRRDATSCALCTLQARDCTSEVEMKKFKQKLNF